MQYTSSFQRKTPLEHSGLSVDQEDGRKTPSVQIHPHNPQIVRTKVNCFYWFFLFFLLKPHWKCVGSHDSLNYEEYYADKNCVMYLVCFLLLPSTSLQLSEKNEEPNYNPVFFVWPFILIKLKKKFLFIKNYRTKNCI